MVVPFHAAVCVCVCMWERQKQCCKRILACLKCDMIAVIDSLLSMFTNNFICANFITLYHLYTHCFEIKPNKIKSVPLIICMVFLSKLTTRSHALSLSASNARNTNHFSKLLAVCMTATSANCKIMNNSLKIIKPKKRMEDRPNGI